MDQMYQSYLEIPPITRIWASITVAMSIFTHFNIIGPFHLYFDYFFIYRRQQYWRLFASFFFVGSFGVDFLFHMYILTRYSRLLEEGSYHSRPADFFMLLLTSSILTLAIAHILPGAPSSFQLPFLSGPVTSALTYVWARRNPFLRMSLFGLFDFQAPFLPWVMAGLSALINGTVPFADLLGNLIGHTYWYFDDIYPRLHSNGNANSSRAGFITTPRFLMHLFGQVPPDMPEVDLSEPVVPEPVVDQPPTLHRRRNQQAGDEDDDNVHEQSPLIQNDGLDQ